MPGLDGRWFWSWQFSEDGSLHEQLRRYKTASAGIIIKVLDGADWMSDFDRHPDSITGPAKAAHVARRCAEEGVPVAFWSVPRGLSQRYLSAEIEATLAAIEAALPSIEAFVLDVEPFDRFWAGTPAQARHLVRSLKGHGVPIIVAPDARPWHLHDAMATFCSEADGIAPQAYWRAFADNAPYYRRAGYDVDEITPAFLAEVTKKVFAGFARPMYIIGQGGDVADAEWRAFVEAARAEAYRGVSAWRPVHDNVLPILKTWQEEEPMLQLAVLREERDPLYRAWISDGFRRYWYTDPGGLKRLQDERVFPRTVVVPPGALIDIPVVAPTP